ncbi:uncharacterized protein [Parasteatoda tepidariorum]|uniref:uncharacterized protein n=1 Tax=Parasteatoda tepidariorum TaxID=114398 RepID=UPI00077FAD38|nr:uncharacterized protein LOC107438671 [Parasteatoda tepidariorum]
MEWCRMYRLRAVICVVLLWCELAGGVPDNRQDNFNLLAERDRKLQELLKSLGSYSSDNHQIMPSEKNYSFPSIALTESSSPKPPDIRGRAGMTDDRKLFESALGPINNRQDYYRKVYGTQEGVNLLRKKYGPNGLKAARAKFPAVNKGMDDVKRANDHYLRMRNRARCRNPAPQILKVKAYYPDPSKDYLPRCAILHRCGDETGCCESDAFHCVPKTIQEVSLHFYTFSVGRNGGDSKVEKLLFQNHTSCHCQPINDMPRRLQEDENTPLDGDRDSSKSKCRDCPVPFNTRIYKDGRCGCDCFDRQKPCLRIKRGRDGLSEIERRCVEANHCHIPECEYGAYDPISGYCPRRHDEAPRHRRPTASHRWSFQERD